MNIKADRIFNSMCTIYLDRETIRHIIKFVICIGVGLVVFYRHNADISMASISTFSISGRDIPNHNSLDVQLRMPQLTTIWGTLKHSLEY